MGGNLFQNNKLLEMKQMFITKFFKKGKHKMESQNKFPSPDEEILGKFIDQDLQVAPTENCTRRGSLDDMAGKRKKHIERAQENTRYDVDQFLDKKMKQVDTILEVKSTCKNTKPSFIRRKMQRSSLADMKSIWRRSEPVRTFTKKDEYMYLDFSSKRKSNTNSKR